MSIESWLSDNGRKAIKKMGAPEWTFRKSPMSLRLYRDKWRSHADDCGGSVGFGSIFNPAVALALLRDWAVQKLAKRGISVIAVLTNGGLRWSYRGETFRDYDAALIVALLAVEDDNG